jgi:hypothetical protein
VTKKAIAAGMVFRKSGNPVPKATVHKILHNRIYTGDFEFDGKTRNAWRFDAQKPGEAECVTFRVARHSTIVA